MEICIVAGARPNFIKLAPIVRAIDSAHGRGVDVCHHLVYTGRKDDPALEKSLFDDLQMPEPEVYLGVDCDNLNELTGQVMSGFEAYLSRHKTDAVIVVDDLASTMAAAIVAKKQGLTLAHLVAGTRSFDINMPKEINRLVIDGLSDLLFTAGHSGSSAAVRTKHSANEASTQLRYFTLNFPISFLLSYCRYSCVLYPLSPDSFRRPCLRRAEYRPPLKGLRHIRWPFPCRLP